MGLDDLSDEIKYIGGRSMYYNMQGEPCSMREWATYIEDPPSKIIAQNTVGNKWVSTVYIGIDHSFIGKGPPIIFETMVFRVREEQEVCTTCEGSGKMAWLEAGIDEHDCFSCGGTGLREAGDIDSSDEEMYRYATIEQAREGHGRVLDRLIKEAS